MAPNPLNRPARKRLDVPDGNRTNGLDVFGIGYVQAAMLAEVVTRMLCLDIDTRKVERLNPDFLPILEPGLESIARQNHAADRVNFTTDGRRQRARIDHDARIRHRAADAGGA
ncbi:hypothetical protein FJW08_31175 [Mesorhizobium sp. B3-2-1]|nr:hypothetical protein [Mesorhizobium sp. ESP7-2]TPI22392.1 hypothetical protein FJW08_31175 [Mesorhizobium sp. B3-2-1]